jgi:sugar (pentulose or hexulose) kinase
VAANGEPIACAKFMGGREFAVLTEGGPQTADHDDLASVIASGAMALPSFVPEGGPFPHRRGSIDGTLPDRPSARAALATLYTALMTDHFLTQLGADQGDLIVEGGFTRNPAFAATLAALRPRQKVYRAVTAAGTAQGAALLATWPKPPADLWQPIAAPALSGIQDYATRWRQQLGF